MDPRITNSNMVYNSFESVGNNDFNRGGAYARIEGD
jgi:hypothetical protein